MLSLSPINFVLGGKTHVEGMTIGAVAVAGSRMVEGGGLLIPAQGLGLVVVHVMLVLPELSPRASITAPADGYEAPLRMLCKMPQMLGAVALNMLASMKAGDPTQQVPDTG
ncbi:MAG TPA: hypothetical protein VN948_00685 [Terriglobales bacterium]|nr:hypothetical protein [Terriglobales bacterium]